MTWPGSSLIIHVAATEPKLSSEQVAAMRARKLIDSASFGPVTLKAIGEAFDAAWTEIASNFGDDPAEMDDALFKLATALLSVASEDSSDVEALKRAALKRMALDDGDT